MNRLLSSLGSRSPFFGLGLLILIGWLAGWWMASNRPVSFGWLGNPRGDGYLAAGNVILDFTFGGEKGVKFHDGRMVVLDDLADLDYLGYRSEVRWWKVEVERFREDVRGFHFAAGFPALIGLHLMVWGGVEGWYWRRKKKGTQEEVEDI